MRVIFFQLKGVVSASRFNLNGCAMLFRGTFKSFNHVLNLRFEFGIVE
ncbi:Uncharacterised protein [Vibrio cholerae]|nr:Uncharacterised protein [Vibrio cholerae]